MTDMGVVTFGRALIESGDLDPVYIGLHYARLKEPQMNRLLLAYWCTYHLGASCFIAETAKTDTAFWELLHAAARNNEPVPGLGIGGRWPRGFGGRWPRGSERRHWRGQQAIDSAVELQQRVVEHRSIHRFIDYLAPDTGSTFTQVRDRVLELRGFGPWITFKVCDMAERVLCRPIDFSDCHLDFYDEPRKGAALVMHGDPEAPTTGEDVRKAVDLIRVQLRKYKAPPRGDRPINVQEAETVLCKYKSHWKGRYHVGHDITEVRHGLDGWGDLAQHVLSKMPEEV